VTPTFAAHGSSWATAAEAQRAASTMTIAERNLSLLLACGRPVKVHIHARLPTCRGALGTRINGADCLFQLAQELRHRAPGERGLFQLRDVSAALQHGHAHAGDAAEVLDAPQ